MVRTSEWFEPITVRTDSGSLFDANRTTGGSVRKCPKYSLDPWKQTPYPLHFGSNHHRTGPVETEYKASNESPDQLRMLVQLSGFPLIFISRAAEWETPNCRKLALLTP